MKIAIISTSCYRKTGGVAQGTWQAALEYANAGHEVHIITLMDYLDNYQFPISDIRIHQIKIYHFSIYKSKKIDEDFLLITKLLTIFQSCAYFIKIISIIRNIHPDIIQTKGIIDAIPAYVTKRLFQIPYTLTIHGNPTYADSNQMGVEWLSKLSKKYWSYFPQVRNANQFISLTSQSRNANLKLFKRDSIIIPNGVDLKKFYPDFKQRDASLSNLEIICVGVLKPFKAMEYAIQSMYFVIKTIPNAHLTIIGDGPLHDSLSQLIKEMNLINNVTLMGLLPHRDILQYLQKSHIFLQPSLSEGFSNALLEAMGCGLPIVATPDASEVISKWHNGYIVPYKDARSIADAIIRISCNDEIVLFSHRSIEASKYYTWNSVAKQYLEQFQNIIKKSF